MKSEMKWALPFRRMLLCLLLAAALLVPSAVMAGVAGHYVRRNEGGVVTGEADLFVYPNGRAFLCVQVWDIKPGATEGDRKGVSSMLAAGPCRSNKQQNYLEISNIAYRQVSPDTGKAGSYAYRKLGLLYTLRLGQQAFGLIAADSSRRAAVEVGGVYRQTSESPVARGIIAEALLDQLDPRVSGLETQKEERLKSKAVRFSGEKYAGVPKGFSGYQVQVYENEKESSRRPFFFLVSEGLDAVYRIDGDGQGQLIYKG